ncbi:MAG: carboxy-S-adenosyl-L-methionine synthase CmoA [Alphaproteobacteria bacterium]|nr:carboxy-S-adenosyl-L-methionine synthase CmoA [Alphaproteobacteria bacterium]
MPEQKPTKNDPRVVPLALDSDPDRLFSEKVARESDFRFDSKTAQVFDDMVERSVPFYGEVQRMTTELAADFAVPGSNLYDFGCATGTTLIALDRTVDPGVRFVGVDNSADMLGKAREKLKKAGISRACSMVEADLNKPIEVENASVSLLLLTLQFVRPLYRERFVKAIAAGTNKRGCIILIEKLTSSDTLFNRLFIDYYYNYKRRNDYSDIEISRKREALENVLIPYREDENRDLLLNAGFSSVEVFFRWYNFCGFVAIK